MFDDPDFMQSTSDCCVYYYHNMFDDPVLHKVPVTVYTIIKICLMNPVLHTVPVTVCILLS